MDCTVRQQKCIPAEITDCTNFATPTLPVEITGCTARELTKDNVTLFQTKPIVLNVLHRMLLICKVFIKHFSKYQFVMLLVA